MVRTSKPISAGAPAGAASAASEAGAPPADKSCQLLRPSALRAKLSRKPSRLASSTAMRRDNKGQISSCRRALAMDANG